MSLVGMRLSAKKTRIRNVQSGLTKYTYQAIFFSLISFYITGSYCQSATRYITFYNVCHDNISYQSKLAIFNSVQACSFDIIVDSNDSVSRQNHGPFQQC